MMRMRRAESFLAFAHELHDLLVVIGKNTPDIGDLRDFMKKERIPANVLDIMRKHQFVEITKEILAGERRTVVAITKEGYAIRGFLEDHWHLMPAVSYYTVYSRLPSRKWRHPRALSLLSPLSPRYKAIEKFFKSRWDAKMNAVLDQCGKSQPPVKSAH